MIDAVYFLHLSIKRKKIVVLISKGWKYYTYFIFSIIGFLISTAFKEVEHNYVETLILGS